ncbi:MAG TPA: CDP-alcohol phosphatidyltransferase family protein [Candidatus Acidoferrales bacterium]|nr:CDP-alcohol phosphatidyltransferase family protein [Candidatus Acidoferrales bacterium]
MRPTRTGLAGSALLLAASLIWLALARPPASLFHLLWLLAVAGVGLFLPGVANQVSLSRAYLAAPALAYALTPGGLGALAVTVALAGLSDLVDGTLARRLDRPTPIGGALDPLVDGVFLGAVAVGLALGGVYPAWLAAVVILRYALPAAVGGALLAAGRRPPLKHTPMGQVSTILILVLLGGAALLRGLDQDAGGLVRGALVAIPLATLATYANLLWAGLKRGG